MITLQCRRCGTTYRCRGTEPISCHSPSHDEPVVLLYVVKIDAYLKRDELVFAKDARIIPQRTTQGRGERR